METHHDQQPRRFYARPADRSFEAYKAFLEYLTASLGGKFDLSEDDLHRAWREFWECADAATPPEGQ
jgi:hypothetical protein